MTITATVQVGDLSALFSAAEKAPRLAVERGAFIAKKVIIRVLQADVGAEQRLSGASNVKVGVNYQMSRTGSNSALVKATGPWQLFSNPTNRHLIIARSLGTRTTAQRVTGRLGANVAFGGSGRGMFRGSRREFTGSKRAIAEGRGQRAKGAITTPAGLRAYAFHPGTTGMQTWRRGVDASHAHVVNELRTVASETMASGMKGV